LNPKKNLLILGGTSEARKLAEELVVEPNLRIITSLAGRTNPIVQIPGELRIGGFGGIPGLIAYLQTEKIDFLIDATHPFAAQISHNAAIAAQSLEIPYIVLGRKPWQKEKEDNWIEVSTMEEAAEIAFKYNRILLTIGRQQLEYFVKTPKSTWLLIRSIEAPNIEISNSQILLKRPPYSLESEKELLIKHQIEAIVSKNSGGETYSKVLAARELGIPIIMVQRPVVPEAVQLETVDRAISAIFQMIYPTIKSLDI
jgi:precorrin-6A/cobalt-precorrin-6A reductase